MPGWGNLFSPPPMPPMPPSPSIWDVQRKFIANGTSQTFDTSDWGVEWMIVSVAKGTAGVWPGYNASPDQFPPWTFNAGQPPVWLPVCLPGDRFVITAKAMGPEDDLDMCVVFASRSNRAFDYSRAGV